MSSPAARIQASDAPDDEFVATDLSRQIGYRLRFAQAAVWNDLLYTFEPFGIRPQHFATLTIVASRPGCTQRQVSARLGMSRSNFVSLLDDLTGRGLVERRPSANDGRANALWLSDAGERLLRELKSAQADHERRLRARMSPDDQEILLRLLRQIEGIAHD